MSKDIRVLKHPERDDRLERVAIQIVDELPANLLEAFIVASKVYDSVKKTLEDKMGERVDYLITKKD